MGGNMKITRAVAEHYFWKDVCDGWHFIKRDDLSVIAEKMPPATAEDMHYHQQSRQFFYILAGEASMVLNGEAIRLQAGEGIEVNPPEPHQMRNDSENAVEFIVISTPKAHGDRVTI